jgi:hypothetical protein
MGMERKVRESWGAFRKGKGETCWKRTREARPERGPQPSEEHSERDESMSFLQAGVFKHAVVRKREGWKGMGIR